MYKIKEIFYTLQGEGTHAGRPSVFCRFSGCNLWSGREQDRHKAICQFCDTDFIGMDGLNGGNYSLEELCDKINSLWPNKDLGKPYVVCTGGEPLLQLDKPLIDRLHELNFEIAIETNGTIIAPDGIDWVCVSPKSGSELVITKGNELKIVYPQADMNPLDYLALDFDYYFIQPMDNINVTENTKKAVLFCLKNPTFGLSLQIHKLLDIP